MDNRKQRILTGLYAFIAQRAGMEPGNYGTWADYRAESRQVTKDLHDARRLLRQIELRDSITADDLIAATRAYSGRLQIEERADGTIAIDYCTGQYFPTEYRRAVCAVCASALWDAKRQGIPADYVRQAPSPGEWMRRSFRREFGHRLASRYFD